MEYFFPRYESVQESGSREVEFFFCCVLILCRKVGAGKLIFYLRTHRVDPLQLFWEAPAPPAKSLPIFSTPEKKGPKKNARSGKKIPVPKSWGPPSPLTCDYGASD